MEDCKFPGCRRVATEHWALVSLCEKHYEEIREETERYYKKRISYDKRVSYVKIIDRIPWSRAD